MWEFIKKHGFILCLIFLIALRFLHFGAEMDGPHDWRQCDTAWYIRDFFKNGIDLLHPAVCWMGAADTLILEFPLPEALVALGYHLTGESIPFARLFFLLFFSGALYYFHKIAGLLFGETLAKGSTLVYAILPLSIYYSRAIHIDFFVVLLSHMMVYYFLKGVDLRRWEYIFLSSLAAALAFVVKIPIAFYWAFPMLYYAIRQKAVWWTIKVGGFYILAVAVFLLWQNHFYQTNNASPDLSYIKHYHKMLPTANLFFGSLEDRLRPYAWWTLFNRGIFEVAGLAGIPFLCLGLWRAGKLRHLRFFQVWILALILGVLIFFHKNVVHNYYQLPLLAPAAILIAHGLETLAASRVTLWYVLFGFVAVGNFIYAESNYYTLPREEIEIASLIREHTPDTALVVVTYGRMDCRNPKILYRANRRGWSVEEAALKPEVIHRLHLEQGAQYWAYAGPSIPGEQLIGYLSGLKPERVVGLTTGKLNLYLFHLTEGIPINTDKGIQFVP